MYRSGNFWVVIFVKSCVNLLFWLLIGWSRASTTNQEPAELGNSTVDQKFPSQVPHQEDGRVAGAQRRQLHAHRHRDRGTHGREAAEQDPQDHHGNGRSGPDFFWLNHAMSSKYTYLFFQWTRRQKITKGSCLTIPGGNCRTGIYCGKVTISAWKCLGFFFCNFTFKIANIYLQSS